MTAHAFSIIIVIGLTLLGMSNPPAALAGRTRTGATRSDAALFKAVADRLSAGEQYYASRVLERGSPKKQAAAAWVLGWLRVPSTIPPLLAAAMSPHLAVDVRAHATEALGVMQAREAVPDLITLLADASPELRYWAAYSLGRIGDPASIPELERVAASDTGELPHDRSVKQEALDALEAIREREQRRERDGV